MKRIPPILGALVALFWLLSFTVAFSVLRFGEGNTGEQLWWDIAIFREAGFWLGGHVFNMAESVPGINYGHILGPGLPFFIFGLVLLSLALGFIAWLIAHKVVSRTLMRRMVNQKNETEQVTASDR